MVSLSPHVATIVPHCAQQCLKSFIAHNFPRNVCRNQQHLDCLCSRKSVSGFTLGEGALQCVASSCSTQVLRGSELEIYELCKDISSALPMTYGTLTATRATITTEASTPSSNSRTRTHQRTMATPESMPVPSTTPESIPVPSTTPESIPVPSTPESITASFPGLSTSLVPTSIATAASWTNTLSSDTTSSIPSSSTDSTTSSTSVIAPTATSRPAPAAKPTLTKAQIAGVTVAGVASAALAFGLLFCIFCCRKRKPNKRLSGTSSFGGDKVIKTRPGSPDLPPPIIQHHEHGHSASNLLAGERLQANDIPAAGERSRWSMSRRNTRPEDIGVAVAHGAKLEPSHEDDHDPAGATSQRTTSRLLPDKPTYLLFPPKQAQLRVVNPGNSPVSPQSPDSFNATSPISADIGGTQKPAPRGRNASDTSQRYLQHGDRVLHASLSDPFLDSHEVAEGLIPAGTTIGAGPISGTRSLETLRKPVPARQYQGIQTHQPIKKQSQPVQIRGPSAYVGRPTFGESSEQIRPAEQAVRSNAHRKSFNNRPSTIFSTMSDTSFEDAGDDEEMPSHPVLSPIAESTKVRSPPGKVTYPKVPTSTAGSFYARMPSPDSPTPKPPPKNPLRKIVAQQQYRSGDIPQPDLAELQGSPVDPPVSPLAGRNVNSQFPDSPRSAKWQILVGSGQEGIENTGPTPSPRRANWRPS